MARRILTKARIRGLQDSLDKIAGIMDRAVAVDTKRVYMRGALYLKDQAKAIVRVKTGRLKKAIFAAYGDPKKQDVLVGVNYKIAPHAHLIEYGTKWARPFPFMRPAVTKSRKEVTRIIAEGLKQILIDHS